MPDKKTKAETISKKLLFFHRQYVKTLNACKWMHMLKVLMKIVNTWTFWLKMKKHLKKKNEIWNKIGSLFFNWDKKCYPRIFTQKCKYATKNKKIISTINENMELSEYDDNECCIVFLIIKDLINTYYVLVIHY